MTSLADWRASLTPEAVESTLKTLAVAKCGFGYPRSHCKRRPLPGVTFPGDGGIYRPICAHHRRLVEARGDAFLLRDESR